MKKIHLFGIGLFIFALLLTGCNQSEEEVVRDVDEALIEHAELFIDRLNAAQYEEAAELFDKTMREQLTSADLEAIWTDLTRELGSMIDSEYDSSEEKEGYEIIYMNAIFEEIDLKFQVTFDEDKKIAGFFIM